MCMCVFMYIFTARAYLFTFAPFSYIGQLAAPLLSMLADTCGNRRSWRTQCEAKWRRMENCTANLNTLSVMRLRG